MIGISIFVHYEIEPLALFLQKQFIVFNLCQMLLKQVFSLFT